MKKWRTIFFITLMLGIALPISHHVATAGKAASKERMVAHDIQQRTTTAELHGRIALPQEEELEFVAQLDGLADAVVIEGNLGYLVAGYDGLWIVNVADPVRPVTVGQFDEVGYARGIDVVGNYAYVASGNGPFGSLTIVDVTDPSMPYQKAFFSPYDWGWAWDVEVVDNLAYVATDYAGLKILNVADPSRPVDVGVQPSAQRTLSVEVMDNIAYIADHAGGMKLVDVSTPSTPSVVQTFTTTGPAIALTVSGHLAYVSIEPQWNGTEMAGGGVEIVDISDPHSPEQVGFFPVSGYLDTGQGIALDNGYLYVANGDNGLRLLDAHTPTRPEELDAYNTTGFTQDIAVAGDHVFVADEEGGLLVFRALERAFQPNPDGYQFCNGPTRRACDTGWGYFPNEPASNDFTKNDLVALFGQDAVCQEIIDGDCQMKRTASLWLRWQNEKMNGGHCFGMAATSLRFYWGIGDTSQDSPSDFQPGAYHTYELDLPNVRRHITAAQMLQFTNPIKEYINDQRTFGRRPSDVLHELQQAMQAGAADPMVLFMYQLVFELILEPSLIGHAVTPYALEYKGGDLWWVRVYDNNAPNDVGRYVEIDVNDESWSYGTWVGGSIAPNSIGVIPVSLLDQRPACPYWCSPLALAPAQPAIGEISMQGKGQLLITNSRGERIGYAGTFVNEIPGAYESVYLGGLGSGVSPTYNLPVTDTYTVLIDGNTAAETESIALMQGGVDYATGIDSLTIAPGTKDVFTVEPYATRISYWANTNREATLFLARDEEERSQFFELGAVDIDAGKSITVSQRLTQRDLVFDSSGTDGGRYDFAMIRVDDDGEASFLHRDIQILGGGTHYIEYGAWNGSGPLSISVDHQSNGSIDEVLILVNQLPTVFLPLIRGGG